MAAVRCPVRAIDMDAGKDHMKCMECLNASGRALAPRYGCGLCQTGVPCEAQIPPRGRSGDAIGGKTVPADISGIAAERR